ncbi:MAG: DUF2239 family protein [Bdellovibrionota bacterium]
MFNYTVFAGFKIISQGNIEEVAIATKKYLKKEDDVRLLIFSDLSGKQMDLDLSGADKDVIDRLSVYKAAEASVSVSGPGRPKIGVKPREVSLLPLHWEWLSTQSGGASATIRRLVDEKMKAPTPKDKIKQTQESVYTFLNSIAGDLTNFEDAIRFLYRQDEAKFKDAIADWPKDLKKHTLTLSRGVF